MNQSTEPEGASTPTSRNSASSHELRSQCKLAISPLRNHRRSHQLIETRLQGRQVRSVGAPKKEHVRLWRLHPGQVLDHLFGGVVGFGKPEPGDVLPVRETNRIPQT